MGISFLMPFLAIVVPVERRRKPRRGSSSRRHRDKQDKRDKKKKKRTSRYSNDTSNSDESDDSYNEAPRRHRKDRRSHKHREYREDHEEHDERCHPAHADVSSSSRRTRQRNEENSYNAYYANHSYNAEYTDNSQARRDTQYANVEGNTQYNLADDSRHNAQYWGRSYRNGNIGTIHNGNAQHFNNSDQSRHYTQNVNRTANIADNSQHVHYHYHDQRPSYASGINGHSEPVPQTHSEGRRTYYPPANASTAWEVPRLAQPPVERPAYPPANPSSSREVSGRRVQGQAPVELSANSIDYHAAHRARFTELEEERRSREQELRDQERRYQERMEQQRREKQRLEKQRVREQERARIRVVEQKNDHEQQRSCIVTQYRDALYLLQVSRSKAERDWQTQANRAYSNLHNQQLDYNAERVKMETKKVQYDMAFSGLKRDCTEDIRQLGAKKREAD